MPDDSPIGESLTLHDRRPEYVEVLGAIATLAADVRHIRAMLDDARERMPRPTLSRVHRAALAPLLQEISGAVGATFWSGRGLLEYASAKDAQLLRALETACGRDDGMIRRLGKLLAQAEGEIVDGYLVTRTDGGRDGCEWMIMRV